jgi:hypothetical protein
VLCRFLETFTHISEVNIIHITVPQCWYLQQRHQAAPFLHSRLVGTWNVASIVSAVHMFLFAAKCAVLHLAQCAGFWVGHHFSQLFYQVCPEESDNPASSLIRVDMMASHIAQMLECAFPSARLCYQYWNAPSSTVWTC